MPNANQILVIKTESRLELLQATSLLPHLQARHPLSEILWVTSRRNRILLQYNPLVTELLSAEDGTALAAILNRKFAAVYCLDAASGGGDIANLARSEAKYGFTVDETGSVILSKDGKTFPSDDCKWNKLAQSYQRYLLDICGFGMENPAKMIFTLNRDNINCGEKFAAEKQLHPRSRPLVVIYLGSAPQADKQLPAPRAVSFLCDYLLDKTDCEILLLGGPRERGFYPDYLNTLPPAVIDGGCNNSLTAFAGIIGLSALLVGTDSLGMHLALALGKKALVIADREVNYPLELYGLGEIIPAERTKSAVFRWDTLNFSPDDAFYLCSKLLLRARNDS